ncbi:protocatechuate 3,4-dioxygenase [soil metagenome]
MIRRHFTAGFAATLLATPRAFAAELTATPSQTEGPFYPVAFPADSDMDLVQVRGQAAQAMGTVLHLQGRVLDLAGKPLNRAMVEIWQCDAQGLYDHPRQPGRERRDAAFQGYGSVVTDAQSTYRFRTLTPVAYPGRTPHIHLKVATADGRRLTSQFYLAGDPMNANDFVYRNVARDPRRLERIEMRLEPAPGIEAGAFTASMDIVIA